MGYYLEPQDNLPRKPSKKAFLENDGIKLKGPEWPLDPDRALVCLIFNGAWWAAGVCYSKAEMEAFNRPDDARQKTWFWLTKEKCYEAMSPSDANSLRKAWGVEQYEPRHN
jgi:hypothetical protein